MCPFLPRLPTNQLKNVLTCNRASQLNALNGLYSIANSHLSRLTSPEKTLLLLMNSQFGSVRVRKLQRFSAFRGKEKMHLLFCWETKYYFPSLEWNSHIFFSFFFFQSNGRRAIMWVRALSNIGLGTKSSFSFPLSLLKRTSKWKRKREPGEEKKRLYRKWYAAQMGDQNPFSEGWLEREFSRWKKCQRR